MTQVPRVTVLMPVYNCAAYVEEAVQSVLNQTYRDFELLIIDDGSSDGSWEILQRFDDPRITLHRNETNLKLIATLNRGLALCRGELIARMDADDVCHPERLAHQVACFDHDPSLIMVSSNITQIDSAGRPLRPVRSYFSSRDLLDWRLSFGNIINHPTVLFRRSAAESVGGYPQDYLHAEDFALWLMLAKLGTCSILPESLLSYRVHSHSVSAQNLESQLRATATAVKSLSTLSLLRDCSIEALEAPLSLRGPLKCTPDEAVEVIQILENELVARSKQMIGKKVPQDARLHMGIAILRVAAKMPTSTRIRLVIRALRWWLGSPRLMAQLGLQVAAKTQDFLTGRIRTKRN